MQVWGLGVAGVNKSLSFGDVEIGLSNLVGVDEIRAGIHHADPRGTWALGFVAASIMMRQGVLGDQEDAFGPNNQDINSDDIIGCGFLESELGEAQLQRLQMPCYAERAALEANIQSSARSLHAGGVHVLLLDGAVRFTGNSISPQVWYQMHSRRAVD
jgi:hypothetical protein